MNPGLLVALARGTFAANGLRIALTVTCIALGVALGGAVHTIHTSALAEIDRSARALAGTADIEIRGPRSGFSDALFATIASRPEVAAANPVVELDAAIVDGENLRVLGIDAFRAIRMQPAFVASAAATGSGQAGTLLTNDAVWLSPAAASRLHLSAGQPLRLVASGAAREFSIAGLLPGLHGAGEIAVMDIAAAQQHFGRIGVLSRIDLRLRPGVDAARARSTLAALLPPGVVVAESASISGRAAELTRAYRVNLDALALVALATGAFLVFSTLALQAARRMQEFALLRALGVTRGGIALLLASEGAILGALGAAFGTALGLVGSRVLLERSGADLGAGYFGGHEGAFAPDPWALGAIAILGVAMGLAGALWVARAMNRVPVADALRDRAIDLPLAAGAPSWLALALFAVGIPLVFAPAVGGLPLGGYLAIALWLAAAAAAVAPLCGLLLGRWTPAGPVASLALAQVRHLPGHLAASVAGIVVSASVCVAMAIMVFSFRVSLQDWLEGVVGADLYVHSSGSFDGSFFSEADQRNIAGLEQVASIEPLRFDRLTLGEHAPPLSLIVRPIDARILAGFQADPPGVPPPGEEIPVWISEAARDLHGWRPGMSVKLPIAGRNVDVRIHGVIRDYARTWGAVMMPIGDYRRLTNDTRANDIAIHLRRGTDPTATERAIRAVLPASTGMQFEEAGELRRRSLEIFERSFAVTYALEAITIVIGLAGVTSSFAALAWSRRREFGVLRFLGFTRRELLRMIAVEGAAAGALGSIIGLVSGAAISLVLIHVVNRQSFHWSLEVHWPVAALGALVAGIIATCAIGARVSGAFAVRHEAILAVKDDA